MGWSKWEHHTELKICPKCGYSKGLLIRTYTLLGKIIRTQIYCEDCQQIRLKKKKKRSPTSLAKRKTQVANPQQIGSPKSTQRLTAEVTNKNVKNFRIKKPKKVKNVREHPGMRNKHTSADYQLKRTKKLDSIAAAEVETLRQRKAIKKLKGRYAVKRKEYQKRYEYLEEEEAND